MIKRGILFFLIIMSVTSGCFSISPIQNKLLFSYAAFRGDTKSVLGVGGTIIGSFSSQDKEWVLSGSDALRFAGDYPVKNMTVFMVVKVTSFAANHAIYGGGDNGSDAIEIRTNTSGKLEFLQQNVASIGSSNSALTTGNIHVLAISYSSIGEYKIYIDGALDKSGTANKTITSGGIDIGRKYNEASEFFLGSIYEVDLYTELTEQEIRHQTNELKKMYQAENN